MDREWWFVCDGLFHALCLCLQRGSFIFRMYGIYIYTATRDSRAKGRV
jgi:hypothetical protein